MVEFGLCSFGHRISNLKTKIIPLKTIKFFALNCFSNSVPIIKKKKKVTETTFFFYYSPLFIKYFLLKNIVFHYA